MNTIKYMYKESYNRTIFEYIFTKGTRRQVWWHSRLAAKFPEEACFSQGLQTFQKLRVQTGVICLILPSHHDKTSTFETLGKYTTVLFLHVLQESVDFLRAFLDTDLSHKAHQKAVTFHDLQNPLCLVQGCLVETSSGTQEISRMNSLTDGEPCMSSIHNQSDRNASSANDNPEEL